MQLNQNIFRANDIRGIAYEDLTEEVVQSLGRALGSEAIDRNIQNKTQSTYAICCTTSTRNTKTTTKKQSKTQSTHVIHSTPGPREEKNT